MDNATLTPLTTAEAELLIQHARSAAKPAGAGITVTILDGGGNLLAYVREDHAVLISGETSTAKAYTALQLDAPTADLVELVKPNGPFYTLPTALKRPLLFIAGGRPIHRDGKLIGAIGVGGGAPESDDECAQTAISAVFG